MKDLDYWEPSSVISVNYHSYTEGWVFWKKEVAKPPFHIVRIGNYMDAKIVKYCKSEVEAADLARRNTKKRSKAITAFNKEQQ